MTRQHSVNAQYIEMNQYILASHRDILFPILSTVIAIESHYFIALGIKPGAPTHPPTKSALLKCHHHVATMPVTICPVGPP